MQDNYNFGSDSYYAGAGCPKQELAQAYCPNVTPATARRNFNFWIRRHPTLPNRLAALGYSKNQRIFTPKQIQAIYEALGSPY